MPKNKNAFLRYKIIDKLLSTGRTFSKAEVLKKLSDLGYDVSEETFNLDLRTLRHELNAPIVYDRSLNGYHYADRKFKINKVELDEEESVAIEFANEALNTLNSIELVQEAQAVLNNLFKGIQKQEKASGKQIIFKPNAQATKGIEWLNILYKAIAEEKALSIKYYKHQTKEIKNHIISPYILREYNDLWYVIAWCNSRELTLVFALDRIQEVKPAYVQWFKDPKFDPNQYFKYSFGITHSHDKLPEKIRFQVTKDAFYYLQVKPLHHSQTILEERKNGYVIEIEVIVSIELARAFLSMGNEVSVMHGEIRQIMNNLCVYTKGSINLFKNSN